MAYIRISNVYLIPDFIPVLGYLDDVILLPMLIAFTLKFIPQDVYEKNRKLAEHMWDGGKPKKWFYAIPIVIIWLFLLLLIVKFIYFKIVF